MTTAASQPDLWTLTRGRPQIDPTDLAAAVEREAARETLDFRSRLLIRDSVDALRQHWGAARVSQWLREAPNKSRIEQLLLEDLGPAGYPTIADRLMDSTKPETVLQFLRELGARLPRPARLCVGGSATLIVAGALSRNTDDIDVVDELPPAVRSEHGLLNELAGRYGLRLAHFQSHYLPSGWEQRLRSAGPFGRLEVYFVDLYDVCLSKLFSRRTKDLDDLRVLLPQLDKSKLTDRLRTTAAALLGEGRLRQAAVDNWFILFGEPLPA